MDTARKKVYSVDGETFVIFEKEYKDLLDKKRLDLKLLTSGIPKEYWNYNIDSYKLNASQRSLVNSFLESCYYNSNNKFCIYLQGPNSVGKTGLISSIAKECLKFSDKKVTFILFFDLVLLLNKMLSFNVLDSVMFEYDSLFRSDILFIDEAFDITKSLMWKGESKNIIVSLVDSFFRKAISDGKKIVTASNIYLDFISNYYSESLCNLVKRSFIVMDIEGKIYGE